MKRHTIGIVLTAAFVGLAGGSTPQYTVMSANATASSSSASDEASAPAAPQSWPDVGDVESTGTSSNDVAVIVAIEDYAFLPDVEGAVENANAWENYFNARGFRDVYTVVNKKAPVEEIKRFAAQAATEAPEGGSLWFVFIGHGAALKDGTDGALIGMDAQQTIESIGARSLPRKELLAMLDEGAQAQTVVVLDTCFSGRDSGGELLAQGTQPVIPVDAAPQIDTGTVVLSAAANDEVAGQLPGAARPAFSYLLLGAMRGWADDGDGTVTADEAVRWTRQQLRHLSGRQQTPSASGDDQLTLAANASESDPGIASLMKSDGAPVPADASEDPANSPSNTTEGTMIDTNKGLVFTKPAEWGVGPAGMGVILSLSNQYSGNAIVVSKMKMRQANAAGMLGIPPHVEQSGIEVIQQPTSAEYGTTRGKLSEYTLIDPEFGNEHIVKFGTYQNGAAWAFELRLRDESARDDDMAAFEEFLGNVQFN
jgi:hypothetical protein